MTNPFDPQANQLVDFSADEGKAHSANGHSYVHSSYPSDTWVAPYAGGLDDRGWNGLIPQNFDPAKGPIVVWMPGPLNRWETVVDSEGNVIGRKTNKMSLIVHHSFVGDLNATRNGGYFVFRDDINKPDTMWHFTIRKDDLPSSINPHRAAIIYQHAPAFANIVASTGANGHGPAIELEGGWDGTKENPRLAFDSTHEPITDAQMESLRFLHDQLRPYMRSPFIYQRNEQARTYYDKDKKTYIFENMWGLVEHQQFPWKPSNWGTTCPNGRYARFWQKLARENLLKPDVFVYSMRETGDSTCLEGIWGLPHSKNSNKKVPVVGPFGAESYSGVCSSNWTREDPHTGIDLDMDVGDTVFVPADGIYAGYYLHDTKEYSRRRGVTVVVDHGVKGDGKYYATSYSHLDEESVKAIFHGSEQKKYLLAGDEIGKIASVNKAGDSSHLHWQAIRSDTPMPAKALGKDFSVLVEPSGYMLERAYVRLRGIDRELDVTDDGEDSPEPSEGVGDPENSDGDVYGIGPGVPGVVGDDPAGPIEEDDEEGDDGSSSSVIPDLELFPPGEPDVPRPDETDPRSGSSPDDYFGDHPAFPGDVYGVPPDVPSPESDPEPDPDTDAESEGITEETPGVGGGDTAGEAEEDEDDVDEEISGGGVFEGPIVFVPPPEDTTRSAVTNPNFTAPSDRITTSSLDRSPFSRTINRRMELEVDIIPSYVPFQETLGAVLNRIPGITTLVFDENIRVTFEFEYKENENKLGKVVLYNLSNSTISLLTDKTQKWYRLKAGFGEPGLIAVGDVKVVRDEWMYPDRKTTLLIVNGSQIDAAATVDVDAIYAPVWTIIDQAAKAAGLLLGPTSHLPDLQDIVSEHGTFTAQELIEKWAQIYDFHAIGHVGILSLFRPGQGDIETSSTILISEETGMIGTPTIKTNTGSSWSDDVVNQEITVKTLLNPTIAPGAHIRIQSKTLDANGFYEVRAIKHTGDTWDGNFVTEILATIINYEGITRGFVNLESEYGQAPETQSGEVPVDADGNPLDGAVNPEDFDPDEDPIDLEEEIDEDN